MKTVNIIEIVSLSISVERITFINIGRTTRDYTLKNKIKRTINKTSVFPVRTLKRFKDLQYFLELAKHKDVSGRLIMSFSLNKLLKMGDHTDFKSKQLS